MAFSWKDKNGLVLIKYQDPFMWYFLILCLAAFLYGLRIWVLLSSFWIFIPTLYLSCMHIKKSVNISFSFSNSRRYSANANVIAAVKAKSLDHVGTFLPTWFFLKIKQEENTYTQTNTCLLHVSRNFKDVFKYICFTLYL